MSKENLPATKGSTALAPAQDDLSMALFNDSQTGSGFEGMTAKDVALPFIHLLQALSPQLRGASKVEGAAEGKFLNSVNQEVIPSPFQFVPVAFKKANVEWKPLRGGYVQEHLSDDILAKTKKNEKGQDILENGNLIAPTAYHFGLLLRPDGTFSRALIALTSTQLKKSRRWNQQMMALQLKTQDGKLFTPPTFSHSYSVKSVEETKDQNTWQGWDFSSPKLITDPQVYKEAKRFHADCLAGLVQVTSPGENAEAPAGEPLPSQDIL